MLTVAWENTMQYFPEFYIMRLLGLHPKALPDSKLQQGVYCRLPDGIAQNYNCKYIFRWLLLLP